MRTIKHVKKLERAGLMLGLLALFLLPAAPAVAQVYDDGQDEEYEYEAGEGLHEEEWYDPSDWFNEDWRTDYEYDAYDWVDYDPFDYDYYDPFDYYDYEETYQPVEAGYVDTEVEADEAYPYAEDHTYTYEPDWDTYEYDRAGDYGYEWGAQATGQVVALKRVRSENGSPESVKLKLKTGEGETRTVTLGDLGYVRENLPKLEKGEQVKIYGDHVQVDGKKLFRAQEIRTREDAYEIPEYMYNQQVRARVTALQKVRTQAGDVAAVVANVRTRDGKRMKLLLGSPEELQGREKTIEPGAILRVDGYVRSTGDEDRFMVQDVDVMLTADAAQTNRRQGQRQQSKGEQGTRPRR